MNIIKNNMGKIRISCIFEIILKYNTNGDYLIKVDADMASLTHNLWEIFTFYPLK